MGEMESSLLSLIDNTYQERELGVAVADIDRWQASGDFVLPTDYRTAVMEFAGAEFGHVEVMFRSAGVPDGARPVRLFSPGELEDTSLDISVDTQLNQMTSAFEDQSQGQYGDWQSELVPFAGSGATGWFCFDYRFDAESPPVVYVDDEFEWLPPEGSGMRSRPGVSYVASCFADFVAMIGDETERPVSEQEQCWEQARLSLLQPSPL